MKINVVDIEELDLYVNSSIEKDILEKFKHSYGLDVMKDLLDEEYIDKKYKIVIESYMLNTYLDKIKNPYLDYYIISLKIAIKDLELKREVSFIEKGDIRICRLVQ